MNKTSLSADADGSIRRRPAAERPGPLAGALEAGVDDYDYDDEETGYQPLWVRLACILLDFLTQTYDQIRIVPEMVLFERWLCDARFPGQQHLHAGLGDDVCRTPEIQYELARLRSWKAFFDGVASTGPLHVCLESLQTTSLTLPTRSSSHSGAHGSSCRPHRPEKGYHHEHPRTAPVLVLGCWHL